MFYLYYRKSQEQGTLCCGCLFQQELFLQRPHEVALLLGCLETAMSPFTGGVDELQGDLLTQTATEAGHQRLSQSDDSLTRPDNASSDHHKVIADITIVGESSNRSDSLLCRIKLSSSIVLDDLAILGVDTKSNAVDLFVDLSTVMVSLLTSSGHCVLNPTWMPGSNTSHFTKTFVCLTREFLTMPTGGHTFKSTTFGNTNTVDKLILLKYIRDIERLFELFFCPVYLVSNGSTIQLDLHQISLLLTLTQKFCLGVGKDTYDLAILLDLVEISFDLLFASIISPLSCISGKCLLFRHGPVLVETTFTFFTKMLSKDSLESSQSSRCLDVSHNANTHHWRSLNNSNSFYYFLLVSF